MLTDLEIKSVYRSGNQNLFSEFYSPTLKQAVRYDRAVGFFSANTTVEQTSPFGFAALAGLVGMFSEQAVLKLKEVAEILLTKPKSGANSIPQDNK